MVILRLDTASSSLVGRLPETVECRSSGSVDDLVSVIYEHGRLELVPSEQLRLSVKAAADAKRPDQLTAKSSKITNGRLTTKAVLQLGDSLKSYGLVDGDVVLVKDLGRQVGWRTVFFVEYLGPFLIHPLFFSQHFQRLIYGDIFNHSKTQMLIFAMILLHYVKRELETVFVHRFSSSTMPAFNIVRNSAHYWLLGGVNMAYFIYGPWFARKRHSTFFTVTMCLVWLWAEIENFRMHMILRNLRAAGTRTRKIPYGHGFDTFKLSCPNYFFEVIGWISVSLLSGSFSAWIFTLTGFYTMARWAAKKHRAYKAEFPSYPPERKAIIPKII